VIVAAENIQKDHYPQLASVEMHVAGSTGDRRVDFTQWHSEEEEAIIYEVKNWTGWRGKTDDQKNEIMTKFRKQMTDYLKAEESKDKQQRFNGVILRIKGNFIPDEARTIIADLKEMAAAYNKTFSYGFI
jgi:hypothetical protein